MDSAIARRLADLNRHFYAEHAVGFAQRRSTPQPGSLRVVSRIESGARVLEVGCGDGKVARTLVANSNIAFYLGLDLDPTMLDRARAGMHPHPASGHPPPFAGREQDQATSATANGGGPGWGFAQADLTSPAWARVLPPEPFDWLLAFSVFHHLPGFEVRAQILRTLSNHLATGGTCVMSNWQFTRSARLKSHIVPWSTLNLAESDVEPNDYLLSWERSSQRGLRYVHLLDEAEARRLAESAGLTVAEVFQSDGVTDNLADYAVIRKTE